jgi:hypothetical protein
MKKVRAIVIAILIIITSFFLIFYKSDIENSFLETMLGLITFLFSIFIAFSISDRHARLGHIIESDSIEQSQLVGISHYSKIFGKEYAKKIKNAIEKYIIATLDYKIEDYFNTEESFTKIVDTVSEVKIVGEKQKATYSSILSMLNSAGDARTKTITVLGDRLSKFEWFIYTILSASIIIILILLNPLTLTSIFMSVILGGTMLLLLYFLYQLDSLKWNYEWKIVEPYQKTLESLGLLRYYPEELIADKYIKNHLGKNYRLAIYPKPYPDMTGKKITIIKR